MTEHKFKIGDWVECKNGRALVFVASQQMVNIVLRNGNTRTEWMQSVKHLPDCDGWDWKDWRDEVYVGEGWDWKDWRDEVDVGEGWRRLAQDEKVEAGDEYIARINEPWKISSNWKDGGDQSGYGIYRRRVEPPKPKYRPFANAEEFAPHRDRWAFDLLTKTYHRINAYDDRSITVGDTIFEFSFAFDRFVFEDLPFGVLES